MMCSVCRMREVLTSDRVFQSASSIAARVREWLRCPELEQGCGHDLRLNAADIAADGERTGRLAFKQMMPVQPLVRAPAASRTACGSIPEWHECRWRKSNCTRGPGARDLAAKLKKAVEDYLASDNEQTVSVDALKSAADKTRFDPALGSDIDHLDAVRAACVRHSHKAIRALGFHGGARTNAS